jgi:asparagine synthase (glutamine-hydrolysing)
MCGIAGVADWTASDHAPSVERQLDQLGHRGPDSRGVHARPGVATGQTRLAVIDLLTGDPPITDETGTVAVALNGEIYNYKKLAEQLRESGHRLATRVDTEVIAHLAEDLAPTELARQLEGMFAFSVWNDRHKRLILCRDRLGKKPLYYWTDGARVVFGSEIKAVLANPMVSSELDADAIPAYLTFGYVPTPNTFFKGVRSVPPGHVLTFDSGRRMHLQRYWEPSVPRPGGPAPLDLSPAEASVETLSRLTAAVERRLIADVPLGAFLSGGVDSSAVVAIMASLGHDPVSTFTIGFEDEEGFDERPYAKIVAERFGTEHFEFVVKPDAVDLVERLVWHHDQPFADSSAVPTFLLSELTRKHVTVALSGDGGDEVFAGYERFAAAMLLPRFQRLPRGLRQLLHTAVRRTPRRLLGGMDRGVRRFLDQSEVPIVDAYREWVGVVPAEWRSSLLPDGSDWAADAFGRIWAATDGAEPLSRLLDLNIRTYLLDDLLPKVDRMSMAHGLEVRSPFLDPDLVEFGLGLRSSVQLRGMAGKRVLKRAVTQLLPDEILGRRKKGFGVPLDRWFRTELRAYLESMIGASTARVRSHVDGEALDSMLAEHKAGVGNHRDSLWALLTLEVFLRAKGW